ncbi:MAG: pyridoxamine 5'-phosphate oxidase [Acidobacteria bacterium]|nr:pyridoxamine 5'-phosphate oxidase [Acidobacteriota bacterium]
MIPDPIETFSALYAQASAAGPEADAMVLATVDPDGRPSARYVLLKGVDARGFVFYTNLGSRKASALAAHPYASLCFYWSPIGRQVRVEGSVERVSGEEADAYFATRPRASQIGAWASAQSTPLESRETLVQRVAEARERFEGGDVPRPPFWSGYRVVPSAIEFWTSDPARLHVRERFAREGGGRGEWRRELLFP